MVGSTTTFRDRHSWEVADTKIDFIYSTNNLQNINNILVSAPTTNLAIADSGSNGNFINPSTPYLNKQQTTNGITAKFPNVAYVKYTHMAELDLGHIPFELRPESFTAHVFPTLQKALVFLGTFVDDNHNIC